MSAPKRQPWLKWFPGDWRAEPRLKMVSRAARSLWLDMLGLMHEAEPYGFLIVARKSLTTPALIAKALGDTEEALSPLLAELEAAGVFSRVGDADLCDDVAALVPAHVPRGTILSRKMLRDEAKREANRKNGGKGGNPILTPGTVPVNPTDNPPVNQTDKGGVKAQRPEARDQKEVIPFLRNGAAGDEKSANGVSAPSKPRSDRDWIWTDGLNWLSKATGRAETGLRSQVGKWLKTLKDDSTGLRSAFEAAQDQDVAQPIAWITKALEQRAKAATPFQPADDYEFRRRLAIHRESGQWPPSWGGKGPGDHPDHLRFPDILAEFGFGNGAAAGA